MRTADLAECVWHCFDVARNATFVDLPHRIFTVLVVRAACARRGDDAPWDRILSARDCSLSLRDAVRSLQAEYPDLEECLETFDQATFSLGEDGLRDIVRTLDAGARKEMMSPEHLAPALATIIARLGDSEERNFGAFLDPPAISRLLAGAIRAQPGMRVHDASGRAALNLNELLLQLDPTGRSRGNLRISGMDPAPNTWRLGRMLLWANGVQSLDYECAIRRAGDKHIAPAGAFTGLRYDRVIASPLRRRGANRPEVAAVEDTVGALNDGGIGAVVVPAGLLFAEDRSRLALRARLVKDDLIEAVVLLPPGALFGTFARCAVLVLNRQKAPARKGRIILLNLGDARVKRKDRLSPVAFDVEAAVKAIVTFDPQFSGAAVVSSERLDDTAYNIHPMSVSHDSIPAPLDPADIDAGADEFLTTQQSRALEGLHQGIQAGGLYLLAAPFGSGKTTVLKRLRSRLVGERALRIRTLSAFDASPKRFDELFRSPRPGTRVVALVDDWNELRHMLNTEVGFVQDRIHRFLRSGARNTLVIACAEAATNRPRTDSFGLPTQLLATAQTFHLGDDFRRMGASVLGAKTSEETSHVRALDEAIVHGLAITFGNSASEENLSLGLQRLGLLPAAPTEQAWLLAALEEASAESVGDVPVALVAESVEARLWELFLRDISKDATWVASEMREAGFDPAEAHANLPLFLRKTGQRPGAFVENLFRPSDVRTLFSEEPGPSGKIAVLRAACIRWLSAP